MSGRAVVARSMPCWGQPSAGKRHTVGPRAFAVVSTTSLEALVNTRLIPHSRSQTDSMPSVTTWPFAAVPARILYHRPEMYGLHEAIPRRVPQVMTIVSLTGTCQMSKSSLWTQARAGRVPRWSMVRHRQVSLALAKCGFARSESLSSGAQDYTHPANTMDDHPRCL